MEIFGNLKIRRYGDAGSTVIVLHGGPGAAGSAEPLAQGLADGFRVIEPWQRGSGGREPLTVARGMWQIFTILCDGYAPMDLRRWLANRGVLCLPWLMQLNTPVMQGRSSWLDAVPSTSYLGLMLSEFVKNGLPLTSRPIRNIPLIGISLWVRGL